MQIVGKEAQIVGNWHPWCYTEISEQSKSNPASKFTFAKKYRGSKPGEQVQQDKS